MENNMENNTENTMQNKPKFHKWFFASWGRVLTLLFVSSAFIGSLLYITTTHDYVDAEMVAVMGLVWVLPAIVFAVGIGQHWKALQADPKNLEEYV